LSYPRLWWGGRGPLFVRPSEVEAGRYLVAVLAGLGLLLVASRAQAFCREVTASPPNGYDPTILGCFNGEDGGALPPLYWRSECVGYSFQRNASSQISLEAAEAVARNAFASWMSAPCSDMVIGGDHTGSGNPAIFASELLPVDCDEVPSQEHNNPIIFRDNAWPYTDALNAIGYTTLTVDLVTGEILGAAIEINTSPGHTIVASGNPPPGAYDLASVLTHEAGHFLGLAHSEQRSAVMFALYQPNTTTLTADDIEGICNIYNPTGSRNTQQGLFAATSCNPEPRLGFLDACGSIDAGTFSGGTPAVQSDVGNTSPLQVDDGGPAPSDVDSGAAPGSAAVSNETLFGCTISRRADSGGLGIGATALGLASAALGQSRRSRRKGRRRVGLGALTLLAGALVSESSAQASVSVSIGFEDLLKRASAAVVVVPIEQSSVWEAGRIATYTHLRVERLLAGQLPSEVWVRTLGGGVGRIGQIVEGEASFSVGITSLVFVHPRGDGTLGVVEGAQGQFPLVTTQGVLRLTASRGGALLPPPVAMRLARDELVDRSLEDAAGAIRQWWPQEHAASGAP
jgi:Matrixin